MASQKGTIASVEGLFERLPVRRKELEKNIKREYAKVLGLLHSYACISTGVKFTVKNSGAKAKNTTVFATNGNSSTRENIANVYGSKSLAALVPLNLNLALNSTSTAHRTSVTTLGREKSTAIEVQGHISRPVFGEGRLTPDRQMFFVNSRPCGLPQIAKAFNEVYKSFSSSQSPFVFADFHMDTNSYDVNVSPDKRTILLHDSANLIENLKAALVELFERQDQTLPHSQLNQPKLPLFKKLSLPQDQSTESAGSSSVAETFLKPQRIFDPPEDDQEGEEDIEPVEQGKSLLNDFFRGYSSTRNESEEPKRHPGVSKAKEETAKAMTLNTDQAQRFHETNDFSYDDSQTSKPEHQTQQVGSKHDKEISQPAHDFNARMREQEREQRSSHQPKTTHQSEAEEPIPAVVSSTSPEKPNIIQNAFDRMRRKRTSAEVATITVGDKTIETVIGSQVPKRQKPFEPRAARSLREHDLKARANQSSQAFGQSLRTFVASGTQLDNVSDSDENSCAQHETGDDESLASEEPEDDGATTPADASSMTESEQDEESPIFNHHSSDGEYVDEDTKTAQEQLRVHELIRQAENKGNASVEESHRRAAQALKSRSRKDSTAQLVAKIDGMIETIEEKAKTLQSRFTEYWDQQARKRGNVVFAQDSGEEERLSLTVSKLDFSKMHIAGQFNLGFILAKRKVFGATDAITCKTEDLFIIDQHASDEKFNFERLQREMVVGNQRLVQERTLDLTAVEEEIIMENLPALEKNGFVVSTDTSGEKPTGRRCKLISLPLSKEVLFDTRDLEELIHLLSENPMANSDSAVPRPSKVRKMFAMRACRSSIMIGKTLTQRQMTNVVRHMGEIDKPWNCPHGRPTMRHLIDLNQLETWREGDGLAGAEVLDGSFNTIVWERYLEEEEEEEEA